MLNTRSFADIYNEILSAENDSGHGFQSGWESTLDAFGMAQLMGSLHIDLKNPTPQRAHKAYPRPARPRMIIVEAPAHSMNPEQSQAFASLQSYHSLLKNNFSFAELKSAYRQAMLKTHPDQGGSSESFQEAKKSYQILAALVKK